MTLFRQKYFTLLFVSFQQINFGVIRFRKKKAPFWDYPGLTHSTVTANIGIGSRSRSGQSLSARPFSPTDIKLDPWIGIDVLVKKELGYRLKKELWCFTNDRIGVRFEYEWHDASNQWYRSYGNEMWAFAKSGLMRERFASINDVPIDETARKFRWERTI